MILYDSQLLTDFYIKNGLEFDTKRNYFGTNIKSYVLKDNENIIAAISFSEYKNVNYIEAIAVDKKYRIDTEEKTFNVGTGNGYTVNQLLSLVSKQS